MVSSLAGEVNRLECVACGADFHSSFPRSHSDSDLSAADQSLHIGPLPNRTAGRLSRGCGIDVLAPSKRRRKQCRASSQTAFTYYGNPVQFGVAIYGRCCEVKYGWLVTSPPTTKAPNTQHIYQPVDGDSGNYGDPFFGSRHRQSSPLPAAFEYLRCYGPIPHSHPKSTFYHLHV